MKKYNTLFVLILALPILLFSCKKDGEIIDAPSFGKILINFTSASSSDTFLLQVDGVVKDTISDVVTLSLETGKRHISIVDSVNKKILDTTVNIDLKKPITLSCFYNGSIVYLDNLDPALKPQRDSVLIRFITSDVALPEIMDIQFSLYDLGGTLIPLPNKTVKGIRKDRFSEYIQFPNPNVFDPSFDSSSFFYVIEGFDATIGGNYKKVMSIDEFNFSYLVFNGSNSTYWTPNSIISLGIGSAAEDGSSPLRNPQVIFWREIN